MKLYLFLFMFFLNLLGHASDVSLYNVKMKPADLWLRQEAQIAEMLLLQNISPAGTYPGIVIASPQNENPNYYRHWVRDAALTMQVVLNLWELSQRPAQTEYFSRLLENYTYLSRQGQLQTGMGEPIFEVNGTPFLGPWGRPQNDGPALRAIVLVQWAKKLLDQGKFEFVKKHLYSGVLPANTVIKADLEFISWHWADPCFDLWEEVKAHHFYTKMVQRKALILGAELARRLNDPRAADWYEKQARIVEKSILEHIPAQQDWILPSLNWTEGLNYKSSNLDISVILGILHGKQDSFFKASDERVLKTFSRLSQAFAQIYPINRNSTQFAPALGRYPEDLYAGSHFNGGNPWVLATLAGAEFSYLVAGELALKNRPRSDEWMKLGDSFIQRVQYHALPNGSLSEQINRHSGYMSSARDLTWNYSAILTTLWARQQIKKHR